MMQHASTRGLTLRFKRVFTPLALSAFIAACGGGGGEAAAQSSPDTSAAPAAASNVAQGEQGFVDRTIAQLTDVGAKGQTYYVAPQGNDMNPGLTLDAPFGTIEKAISIVNPGDTIELRGGEYRPIADGYFVARGGAEGARIKIKAHNGEKVFINAFGKQYGILIDVTAPYWIVEGLEIGGGDAYALKIDSHHVNIVRNNIHGSRNDNIKMVQTSNDIAIFGNEIHHNDAPVGHNAQAVDITGGNRTWVAHNYVHNIPSIGMYAKGNSRNIIFENNRVENIAMRGIMLGQSTGVQYLYDGPYETYDGIIRNNVIVNTEEACLATASSLNVKIYNNTCYNAASRAHGAIFISNESELGIGGMNVEVKNNVIVGTSLPVIKLGPNAMGDINTLSIDKNVYWNTNGPVTFLWEDRGILNEPIENWRAKANQDVGSMAADPLFEDLGTLRPAGNSPAVNAGMATDLVRDDHVRAGRPNGAQTDIGAYEVM